MGRTFQAAIRLFLCSFVAILCVACASANTEHSRVVQTGRVNTVYANGMRIGSLPNMNVQVSESLVLAQGGSRLASLPSDTNLKASADFDYAIFIQEDQNAVQAEAHILVTAISDEYSWRLAKETFPQLNEVSLGSGELGGLTWRDHFMYVDTDGDWISKFLQTNTLSTPQFWLARRWSKSYADKTRVVLEYREPMPDCVLRDKKTGKFSIDHKQFLVNGPECDRVLADFNARAEATFSVTPGAGRGEETPPPATAIFTTSPQGSPNMKGLVGTANAGGIWESLK